MILTFFSSQKMPANTSLFYKSEKVGTVLGSAVSKFYHPYRLYSVRIPDEDKYIFFKKKINFGIKFENLGLSFSPENNHPHTKIFV